MKRCQKLPLCPIQPFPLSYKADLPLTITEPISDTSISLVTTHLRGKNCCTISSWQNRVRISERNNYTDTKASKGGGEGAPDITPKILVQPVVQHKEVHGGTDIHLQPRKDPSL